MLDETRFLYLSDRMEHDRVALEITILSVCVMYSRDRIIVQEKRYV